MNLTHRKARIADLTHLAFQNNNHKFILKSIIDNLQLSV